MARLKKKPAPQPPPSPPPAPPPSPPPTGQPITKDTPWRDIPRLQSDQVRDILADYPMGPEAGAITLAVLGRALPIAQSWMESNYGQSENARRLKNPLGLMVPGSNPSRLMTFTSYAEAFAEWARRMGDPTYSGGVYPREATLEEFIHIYVGGPGCLKGNCANGETPQSVRRYLDETVKRLNRYFGHDTTSPPPPPTGAYTAWDIAGSDKPLLLPKGIRFEVQLTPVGPNRSQRPLNWTGVTQHETGNESAGATAQMHATWQANGTPGHPDGKIGVHFYVDDHVIIQTLPINEQGVHSGDWRNQQHVSAELCVNQGRNQVKAEQNAMHLMAGLLKILGETAADVMYPHRTKPGPGCPVYLGQRWIQYEREVDAAIRTLPN